MVQTSGILSKVRRAMFRYLTGLDIHDVLDERAQLHAAMRDLTTANRSMLDWIRGAEEHLASLQAAYERVGARVEPNNESQDANVTPIVSWMLGAEQHLAALQSEHKRISALSSRLGEQLTRVWARLALLESRLGDLERADTAIAAAYARAAIGSGLE